MGKAVGAELLIALALMFVALYGALANREADVRVEWRGKPIFQPSDAPPH